MTIKQAVEWLQAEAVAQGADLKTDVIFWSEVIYKATEKFDIDIDTLEAALCRALSIEESPMRAFNSGVVYRGLQVISDPAEVARYQDRQLIKGNK